MSSYALRKLEIRRYRSLIGPVSLDFSDGPVFLLGQNGSGKTTLLKLIAVCLSGEVGELIRANEAIDLSWEIDLRRHGAPMRLAARLSVQPLQPTGARAAFREGRASWEYELLVRDAAGAAVFRYRSGSDGVHVTEPELNPIFGPVPNAEIDGLVAGLANALAIHDGSLQPIGALFDAFNGFTADNLGRLDEALAMFELITEPPDGTGASVEADMSGGAYELVPDAIALPLLGLESEPGGDEAERPTDPIARCTAWLGAERIEAKPRLTRQDEQGRRNWHGFDFYVHWPGGVMHHHSQLSFGQKRLIAFSWYAALAPESPLLTDELTNGLHAGWVREIVDWLADRQAFHAVQNPLLLDRTGPRDRAQLRGRFVLCAVDTVDNARRWTWRNPTEEEADRLWASWDAGFQQLSEVLLSEGLW